MSPHNGTAVVSQSGAPATSYWDAPAEKKLQGKTLSTLNLSGLAHVEHGNHDEPKSDAKPASKQEETPVAAGSYWDAPPEEKLKDKTLSTLSLTGLAHVEHGNHEEPQADTQAAEQPAAGSYWDAPADQKLEGKTLSTLSLTGLGRNHKEAQPAEPQGGGYWGWQETIKKTLSKLSLSDLVHGSRGSAADAATEASSSESENETASPSKEEPKKPEDAKAEESGTKIVTMQKNAKASDRVEGQPGPISNLQHRMRTSWRASFQRLSTNTLSALDETPTPSGSTNDMAKVSGVTEGWRSNTGMRRNDSFVVQEDEDGEDGMTF